MNAIVTGGAGFIGSNLVDLLIKKRHSVAVIDNFSTGRKDNLSGKECQIYKVDIADYGNLDLAMENYISKFNNIDWIFHLAGLADIVPSVNEPAKYFRANVTGTLNMLELARKVGIKKFVYASSSSIYGIPPDKNIPTPETTSINPQYPYAETKYQGERWASHYNLVYGLPAISLRLFNVYGLRSRTSGTYGAVFGVFLAQKINNKPFTVVGNGLQSRDFVFVTDVCDAFLKAAESSIESGVFNVGSNQPQTILRLCNLLGGNIVYIPKRPGEPDTTWADTSLIREKLGWKPEISFEDGVGIMLKNIDFWKNAPVWTSDNIRESTQDWFKFLGRSEGGSHQ